MHWCFCCAKDLYTRHKLNLIVDEKFVLIAMAHGNLDPEYIFTEFALTILNITTSEA